MHPKATVAPDDQKETPAARRERFWRIHALIHDERRRHLLLFSVGLLTMTIVATLATLVRLFQVLPIDVVVTREIQAAQWWWFRELMIGVSIFGYMPWAAIMVAIGTLIVGIRFGREEGAYLLLITIVQGLTNAGIKIAIGRPRPLDTIVDVFAPEHGNSFPSGHVMFYTVFFGFLLFLAWLRLPRSLLRWLVILVTGGLVLLVGPSRIFLGAHWLSDVVAAYLLGLVILGFAIEFYLKYIARQAPAPEAGQP